jgi:translation initiation factor IF-1
MKEEKGVILRNLPNQQFVVALENGESIVAYLSVEFKHQSVRVIPGEHVTIIPTIDPTRGKIIALKKAE